MSGSLNKVTLIGNLGADPEVRSMQSGDEVCNLSIATSETWKDKASGERKEKTEWHRVVIFSPGLVNVCKNYLKKGSKIYLEGQLQTRSWEQDGQKKYTTEVVLRGYDAKLVMLDGRSGNDNAGYSQGGGFSQGAPTQAQAAAPVDELEDEIPF
ncbi:MAG TPA: single-stranded DNA-binding protein [Alphaproteobacteria bacterium]|nr:single-stranded DNA-binding protein [Alphaproteobacteria bacterium]USO06577.1 MAG: single-stranded DNA-binding protein [Rhodospirillales bacterium]HOO81199.1 single-stranded DNA-binding protein [Alphaproteobacteria bacterium]